MICMEEDEQTVGNFEISKSSPKVYFFGQVKCLENREDSFSFFENLNHSDGMVFSNKHVQVGPTIGQKTHLENGFIFSNVGQSLVEGDMDTFFVEKKDVFIVEDGNVLDGSNGKEAPFSFSPIVADNFGNNTEFSTPFNFPMDQNNIPIFNYAPPIFLSDPQSPISPLPNSLDGPPGFISNLSWPQPMSVVGLPSLLGAPPSGPAHRFSPDLCGPQATQPLLNGQPNLGPGKFSTSFKSSPFIKQNVNLSSPFFF